MQMHEVSQTDVSMIDPGDDERLIREGEAAVKRFKKSRDQILPMARGLLAAKRKFSATRVFGAWLKGSPYSKIGDQDRAALIQIGEQLDERDGVVVEFLRATNLVSPHLIWTQLNEELQPQPTLTADADASAVEDGPESGDPSRIDTAETLGAETTRRCDEFVEIRFDSVRETRRVVEALRAAGLIVMVDDDCRHRVIDLAAGHPTRGDLKGSGATDLGTEDPRVHTWSKVEVDAGDAPGSWKEASDV
jgi:hypothetical protein